MRKQKSNFLYDEEQKIRKEWKNISFNILFAFFCVVFVILFYKNIILTTILLSTLTLISLIKWKSKLTILIFLIGALWGPICEIVAIHFGVWSYSNTNFLSIPLWLFILWGNAAVFLYQTSRELKKLGVKE